MQVDNELPPLTIDELTQLKKHAEQLHAGKSPEMFNRLFMAMIEGARLAKKQTQDAKQKAWSDAVNAASEAWQRSKSFVDDLKNHTWKSDPSWAQHKTGRWEQRATESKAAQGFTYTDKEIKDRVFVRTYRLAMVYRSKTTVLHSRRNAEGGIFKHEGKPINTKHYEEPIVLAENGYLTANGVRAKMSPGNRLETTYNFLTNIKDVA